MSPTLLSLPAEVRLNIYTHLFASESVYIDPCIYTTSPTPTSRRTRNQQYGHPLMQTCRLLRDEASPSYFSSLRVHFDVCRSLRPVGLINWLDDIGPLNAKLLMRFEMRWNDYVDVRLELTRDPRSTNAEIYQPEIITGSTPLVDVSSFSTKCTSIGSKYVLSIQGVPEHEPEYWKRMGTKDFCQVLCRQLSARLDGWLMEREGVHLSEGELVGFVAECDGHASALRWLWYW